jgi:hypothetical protein
MLINRQVLESPESQRSSSKCVSFTRVDSQPMNVVRIAQSSIRTLSSPLKCYWILCKHREYRLKRKQARYALAIGEGALRSQVQRIKLINSVAIGGKIGNYRV